MTRTTHEPPVRTLRSHESAAACDAPRDLRFAAVAVTLMFALAVTTRTGLLAEWVALAAVALVCSAPRSRATRLADEILDHSRTRAAVQGLAAAGRGAATGVGLLAISLTALACLGSGSEPGEARIITLSSPIEGVSATTEVTAPLGGFYYEISLAGLPEGRYTLALADGSCESPGPTLERLSPLFAGANGSAGARGPIETPLDAIEPWHLAVLDESGGVIACGAGALAVSR